MSENELKDSPFVAHEKGRLGGLLGVFSSDNLPWAIKGAMHSQDAVGTADTAGVTAFLAFVVLLFFVFLGFYVEALGFGIFVIPALPQAVRLLITFPDELLRSSGTPLTGLYKSVGFNTDVMGGALLSIIFTSVQYVRWIKVIGFCAVAFCFQSEIGHTLDNILNVKAQISDDPVLWVLMFFMFAVFLYTRTLGGLLTKTSSGRNETIRLAVVSGRNSWVYVLATILFISCLTPGWIKLGRYNEEHPEAVPGNERWHVPGAISAGGAVEAIQSGKLYAYTGRASEGSPVQTYQPGDKFCIIPTGDLLTVWTQGGFKGKVLYADNTAYAFAPDSGNPSCRAATRIRNFANIIAVLLGAAAVLGGVACGRRSSRGNR